MLENLIPNDFKTWWTTSPEGAAARQFAHDKAAAARAEEIAKVGEAQKQFDRDWPRVAAAYDKADAALQKAMANMRAAHLERAKAMTERHNVQARYERAKAESQIRLRTQLPDVRIETLQADIEAECDQIRKAGAKTVTGTIRTLRGAVNVVVANQDAIAARLEHLAMMRGKAEELRLADPSTVEKSIDALWDAAPSIDKWDDEPLARELLSSSPLASAANFVRELVTGA